MVQSLSGVYTNTDQDNLKRILLWEQNRLRRLRSANTPYLYLVWLT